MVVQLGQMQLPAPQDPDPSDDYFNGTISGGGLWTALTRASDHDHTGGVNGKPISVAGIPDGSITTAKLDPSVLLPYALVDGSKPFTGQVTMNADALIRNTLYFGAKPAGAGDVSLARMAAGRLRLTGVGSGANTTLEVQSTGNASPARFGQFGAASPRVEWSANTYYDGTNWQRDDTGKGSILLQSLDGGATLNIFKAVAGTGAIAFGTPIFGIDGAGNVGLATVPGAWRNDLRAFQIGGAAIWAQPPNGHLWLSTNGVLDNVGYKAIAAGEVGYLRLSGGMMEWTTAPTTTAGAAVSPTVHFRVDVAGNTQVIGTGGAGQIRIDAPDNVDTSYMQLIFGRAGVTNRWRIGENIAGGSIGNFDVYDEARSLAPFRIAKTTGDVSINPAQATVNGTGLHINRGFGSAAKLFLGYVTSPGNAMLGFFDNGGTTQMVISSAIFGGGAGDIVIASYGAQFRPVDDATRNCGTSANRWAAVYSSGGVITSSTYDLKEDFAPLDPAVCAEAVLGTDWLDFTYRAPTVDQINGPSEIPPEGDLATPKERAAIDKQRLESSARVIAEGAVARRQKGYVLQSPDHKVHDLFGLIDRKSASPGSDLAVVACALQDVLRRLAALEGAPA